AQQPDDQPASLADDLTTQDFIEPYRMLTSRAEHRLLLRADNADDRLVDLAYDAGLVARERLDQLLKEREAAADLGARLDSVFVSPNKATQDLLRGMGLPPVARSQTAREYLRRPEVSLDLLLPALKEIHPETFAGLELDTTTMSRTEVAIKYEAYIEKELQQIARVKDMEESRIPSNFSYEDVPGLRNEARERLQAIRPTSIGQASRIAGVTPSDVSVLVVHLRRRANVSNTPGDLVASGGH
ncbi:MAG: tRNA uridine-5-carboxymethylaminomethyl(34) synthesis enzyme MnmG, partial [Chloroflexota bacterium]